MKCFRGAPGRAPGTTTGNCEMEGQLCVVYCSVVVVMCYIVYL